MSDNQYHSCANCKFYEYGFAEENSWTQVDIFECHADPRRQNLKQFPFKRTQCADFEQSNN